jgi:hypothetical protein
VKIVNERYEVFQQVDAKQRQLVKALVELYEMGAFYSDVATPGLYGFFENGAKATLHEGNGPKRIFLGQGELFEALGSPEHENFRIIHGNSFYKVHSSALKQLQFIRIDCGPKPEPGKLYRLWRPCYGVRVGENFRIPLRGIMLCIGEVCVVTSAWGYTFASLHTQMLCEEYSVYTQSYGLKLLHED